VGSNSVKALKLLGVSEQTHSFSFRGQEIAAVFDLPLLLKCALKLLLKHEVMNVGFWVVVNGQPLTGTAKWVDILNVNEINKQNVLYHLLRNVIDRKLKIFQGCHEIQRS
jgi:hypothetical protein